MQAEIAQLTQDLKHHQYIAGRSVVTAIHLASTLGRPLLVEGPSGVGKTEIANVMAQVLGTELIRLQCYEGIDTNAALYEWNYQKQLLHIRLSETPGTTEEEIFGESYLLKRPLLQAITLDKSPVLLLDEIDRSDEEFEAFLLELLSDWQVSIPELGTIRARQRPYTVLTSNRTRELSDALRRRCFYLWIDFPSFEKELEIVRVKVPEASEALRSQIVAFVQMLRRLSLEKSPGISETLDWAAALVHFERDQLSRELVESTLGLILKHSEDQNRMKSLYLEALLGGLEGFSNAGLERAFQRVEAAIQGR